MNQFLTGALSIALLIGGAGHAVASSINVSLPISLSPTSFALPIDVSNAVNVVSWQFDLSYDPTDVQVNTSCDPSSDVYCSFLTGAVTEGDFFAAGAPFNLLNPGFIELDPGTQAQTGLLSGVNGAFGGSGPAPSGSGSLVFVEFTILGNGDSPITVKGSPTSLSPVPEPGTLMLLGSGFLLPYVRRVNRQRSRR
jgi:hypothetical protein